MRPLAIAVLLLAMPITAHAASLAKGQEIYGDRCSMCHVEEGQGQGPNLKGVVGRRAASLPNFPYTDALKKSGLTWTPATLGRFLINPTKMVPGTAMPMMVPEAADRDDLIAFLDSQR